MCVRVCLCLYFALVFCIFCLCWLLLRCSLRFASSSYRIFGFDALFDGRCFQLFTVSCCLQCEKAAVTHSGNCWSSVQQQQQQKHKNTTNTKANWYHGPHIWRSATVFFFFNTYTPRSTLCTRAFACVGVCVTVCRCVWQLHFLAANVKFSLYLYSRVVVSSVAMWLSSVKNSIKQIIQVRREKSVTKMCVNILKRILCKEKNPATIMWHACLCYCCSP